ncbi:EAL domain-containing protein [Paenibacillus puerhi]|uniref:EAL domain-containing protein n=1 Tax=Paenibacillus puerhi TaxID=2692622 RepID=UPI0013579AA3|nr:EAL domain-containing protein [Paenibacillus puerhi]
MKVNPGTEFGELQRKSQLLQRELERRLQHQGQAAGIRCESAQFVSGCYVIGPDIENTAAAVQHAYHYARSIATKKLPAHFSEARNQLLEIVKHEKISVLAQPIMNLSSGDIFGWEILTRGPQNTPFHTPAELFDLAYQADLLSRMEFVVLKKAFREISERRIREQVFINVTPVSLGHPLFLNQLLELLNTYPEVSSSQVVLEITERHAIRDFEHLGAVMKAFRAHGFRFAVDDAGAGYSSLQSISELIPDMIKIDRSVISNIDQISVKQSMLKALLHVAEHINCEVIAEGVERKEEADTLVEMRVNMVQGFYFARPQPLVPDQERVQQLKQMKEKMDHHRRILPA